MVPRFPFLHFPLITLLALVWAASPAILPATGSPTDDVSEAQLKSYLSRQVDSDYATDDSADYTTGEGRNRARTDIAMESHLARCAETEGLTSHPVVMARLSALRRHLLADFAQDRINRQTTVTQEEIATVYRDNPTSFTRQEVVDMVLCQVRLATPDGAIPAETDKALEATRKALVTAVVPPHDLPYIDGVTSGKVTARPGELPAEVEKVIFATTPGKVTPIIRRTRGAYVAKVLTHQKAGLAPLEEVQDYLTGILWQEKRAVKEQENLRVLTKSMPLRVDEGAFSSKQTTGTTVVAHVGKVPITLDEIALGRGGIPDLPMNERDQASVQRVLETLALQVLVAAWAEGVGIDREEAFRIRWDLDRNKMLTQLLLDEVGRTAAESRDPSDDDLQTLLKTGMDGVPFEKRAECSVESLTLTPQGDPEKMAPAARDAWTLDMKNLAESLRSRAAQGEPLKALAGKFDETSFTLSFKDLGMAPEGPRGRRVDMAVKGLKKGGVSPLLEGKNGALVLFKLTDIVPPRPMSLEQDRPELVNLWRHIRATEARKKLLDEAERSVQH